MEIVNAVIDNIPPVRGDPAKLKQIFSNLLSNAIKFTPNGGQIVISAVATTDGGLVVEMPSDKPHGLREATILSPEGYAFSPAVARRT